jgi:hypothetical protein
MSEYQYYEFQAIDRPLSQQEMAKLRALSTRATITRYRFVNVYHWGDFGGDPAKLMENYFDAFVYVANWGTYRFMLRLPRRLLALETVEPYFACEWTTARVAGDAVILEFLLADEGYDDEKRLGWITDEQAAGWLPGLLPLRAELASGDLRCLYLGWLLCAQGGMLDDEEIEPPVPPGLGRLSAALRAFAEFFWLDQTLIEIAAERSADLDATGAPRDQLERWIHELPDSEKDALLFRVAAEGDPHLRAELLQQFQRSTAVSGDQTITGSVVGRTVGQLVAAAEHRAEVKRQESAEREARERARRAKEAARARAAYLDDLAPREEEAWRRVEAFIETKRPKEYDQAVALLRDLHDLGVRDGQTGRFGLRLRDLRQRYATRPALLQRLKQAGL